VASGASSTGELDVGTRVDSQAVVLVLDVGTDDADVGRRADVEGVGVVAKRVTGRVVDGDVLERQVGGAVDGEGLDRGVLNVEALDGGLLQAVGVEELGLGDTTVGALTVPPLGTVSVDNVARGSGDSDVSTGDADERSIPLLVLKSRGTLELWLVLAYVILFHSSSNHCQYRSPSSTYSDGSTAGQASEIESSAGRDSDAAQDDVGARSLASAGRGRGGEGTGGGTALSGPGRLAGSGGNQGGGPEKGKGGSGTHFGGLGVKSERERGKVERRHCRI
jgi:hypothetical protein